MVSLGGLAPPRLLFLHFPLLQHSITSQRCVAQYDDTALHFVLCNFGTVKMWPVNLRSIFNSHDFEEVQKHRSESPPPPLPIVNCFICSHCYVLTVQTSFNFIRVVYHTNIQEIYLKEKPSYPTLTWPQSSLLMDYAKNIQPPQLSASLFWSIIMQDT